MAHFNSMISAAAFAFAAVLGLAACGGDNSTIFPDSSEESAGGAAGAAGGSSVQPPTAGGSAGAAGETFNPPAGGAAGEQPGGAGGSAGAAGSGGSTSTGGSSNTGGASGAGGSTSTGGSGGSSDVTPPDAGTSGTGGSSNTGGASGAGGSTSIGGSGGSTSTGGSGGAGTLEITIVPATSGQHAISAWVGSITAQVGEPAWDQEYKASGTRLTFTVTAYQGSEFRSNGYYDPEAGKDPWQKQFCDLASGKPTVAFMAKFNGQPIATPTVVDNGQGGCNLKFFATPLVQDFMDADGDGEAYGQGLDCDDADAFRHHGAIETPDDQVDYDCDGNINPLKVFYRLIAPQTSYVPRLDDWSHGGKSYNLAWNANGYYEVGVEKPVAAREFVIQYAADKWSVGMVNGNCQKNADVTAHLEQFNTTYNVDMVAYSQYNTCHSVLTNLQ